MKRLRDALAELLDLSPEGQAYRAKVVALAGRWAAGGLDINDLRRRCSGYERNRALRATPMDHPDHGLLLSMAHELVANERIVNGGGGIQTKHGFITDRELAESGARVNHVTGRIDFPIRWPWAIRPKRDEQGRLVEEGVRSEPIYARDAEDRWRIANDLERRAPKARDDWE